MSVRVSDVVDAVHGAFPHEWAESWDRVGLLAGDPDAEVSRVLVSLDANAEALQRARSAGAGALVTHHPPFLDPPTRLVPAVAGIAYSAVAERIALIAAHTNLDRAPAGAVALARLLGLEDGRPLEEAPLPLALVTVYVPPAHESELAAAMSAGGAGRIGEYHGCSFSVTGTGRFTPGSGTDPHSGTPGAPSSEQEVRLEMVCPRDRTAAVLRAARSAHPYEEPLITISDVAIARGSARMGRVSLLPDPLTLDRFAVRAAEVFGVVPRVWGEPVRTVRVVATATGSAGSLIPAAVRAGADVLLAGEVRYHDAQTAVASGVSVVEVGHDVSEWPLVPVLADAVAATPGLDSGSVIVDPPGRAWWTPQRSE